MRRRTLAEKSHLEHLILEDCCLSTFVGYMDKQVWNNHLKNTFFKYTKNQNYFLELFSFFLQMYLLLLVNTAHGKFIIRLCDASVAISAGTGSLQRHRRGSTLADDL
jgi:hypothetical protein